MKDTFNENLIEIDEILFGENNFSQKYKFNCLVTIFHKIKSYVNGIFPIKK